MRLDLHVNGLIALYGFKEADFALLTAFLRQSFGLPREDVHVELMLEGGGVDEEAIRVRLTALWGGEPPYWFRLGQASEVRDA